MSNAIQTIVTGGAGFLGSHICERILSSSSNARVLCVDNLSTGSEANLAAVLDDARFKLLRHDVIEPYQMHGQEIYNLACPASPLQYQKDPVATTKTSVYGAINLLDVARANGARILQASTSEVYGDPEIHPQPESYLGSVNPIGPRACYDEGKRCAESLFFDYHRKYGVPIRVARIFNTYGPRMLPGDGRVVSNFIVQALRNEPITIFGGGDQTRSFCYVADLVDALVRLMTAEDLVVGPVNLGSSEEIRIAELAELVVQLTNSRSRIVLKAAAPDDPRRRRPDTRLACEKLGWKASTPLRAGLAATIDYMESLLRGARIGQTMNASLPCESLAVAE